MYLNDAGEELHIYSDHESILGSRFKVYKVGKIIQPVEKGWIVRTMKQAGHNLCEINKEIRHLQDNWEGKIETIII